jgi:hypothetical protein
MRAMVFDDFGGESTLHIGEVPSLPFARRY